MNGAERGDGEGAGNEARVNAARGIKFGVSPYGVCKLRAARATRMNLTAAACKFTAPVHVNFIAISYCKQDYRADATPKPAGSSRLVDGIVRIFRIRGHLAASRQGMLTLLLLKLYRHIGIWKAICRMENIGILQSKYINDLLQFSEIYASYSFITHTH